MEYLRNYFNYKEFLSLKDLNIIDDSKNRIVSCGFFSKCDDDLVGIFVKENNLQILINDLIISIDEIDNISFENSRLIISYQKQVKIIDNCICRESIDNPFFYEESEDNNFCLLINNIYKNPNRKEIFINANIIE